MKSIKKRNNSFWMIGSFLIILVLFLLLLSKTPIVVTEDTIDFGEVIALIEALNDDIHKKEQFDTLMAEQENEQKQNDTTYGMLKETLDILDSTKALSARILDNVSKDRVLERDKFFSLYETLIDEVGKRD